MKRKKLRQDRPISIKQRQQMSYLGKAPITLPKLKCLEPEQPEQDRKNEVRVS